MGDYGRAEEELKAAIRIKPDYATPHFNLAALYIDKKMYGEALEEFQRVLDIRPDFPNARDNYDRLSRYLKFQALMKQRKL